MGFFDDLWEGITDNVLTIGGALVGGPLGALVGNQLQNNSGFAGKATDAPTPLPTPAAPNPATDPATQVAMTKAEKKQDERFAGGMASNMLSARGGGYGGGLLQPRTARHTLLGA